VSDSKREAAGNGSVPTPKKPARKPFLLRIPPSLMEDLRGWADSEMRSLNGHIEFLLRQSVKRRKGQEEES